MSVSQLSDSERQLIANVRQTVTSRLATQHAGHGMDHILRVYKSACQIAAEIPCDRFIVELAALLHDVGDAKFHDGVERSGEFSRQILGELGLPTNQINHVAHIVDNISFRKAVDRSTLCIEGKVVQDADRLDALGAIGIVRTVEYGSLKGQPFSVPGQDLSQPDPPGQTTGVGHFYDKLFRLKALLNTQPAKCIADAREQFMRDFIEQLSQECG